MDKMMTRILSNKPQWAKVLYVSRRLARRYRSTGAVNRLNQIDLPLQINPILKGQSYAFGEMPLTPK